MRLVIQRVQHASVTIERQQTAAINQGLLILVGIEASDTLEDIHWLCSKVVQLRIFSDTADKMNLSVKDINGDILVVSQFTLHASTKKGNRPSYTKAAVPDIAIPLYETFVTTLSASLDKPVATGTFGADMQIALTNDGPVTIIMDSKNRE